MSGKLGLTAYLFSLSVEEEYQGQSTELIFREEILKKDRIGVGCLNLCIARDFTEQVTVGIATSLVSCKYFYCRRMDI